PSGVKEAAAGDGYRTSRAGGGLSLSGELNHDTKSFVFLHLRDQTTFDNRGIIRIRSHDLKGGQMLSIEQLAKIMPNCNAALWLDPLNSAMSARHIDNPMRMAAFLAHVAVESGETRTLVENMNYSADRM